MRRAAVCLFVALAVASCAPGPRGTRARDLPPAANPSAVISAELAFARAAQEKGQWTAFAEFAADDAVMFVPEPVNAKQWLRGRDNPARAVTWQPYQVWSSCDGTLAVTKGAWQRPNGTVGYFTTVWERRAKGEYEWVMDQGDLLAEPLPAPEMIAATVAECGSQPTPPATLLAGPNDKLNSGAARDGTLRWHVVTKPDGSRNVSATYWNGSTFEDALNLTVRE
jgi:hypothetical protein